MTERQTAWIAAGLVLACILFCGVMNAQFRNECVDAGNTKATCDAVLPP